ncbi:contractile injection system tape measure protein [Flavobacterium fluviale]|nr:contractile injection system tape measure protein [Flavobacterium fluviale]
MINTVFLEINTNSKEKGYYLKDNIDAFLQKEIFSLLENYFNELDSKNPSQSIQLEKLNIDIVLNQNLDFEDFKEQILKNISKQVEEVFEKEAKNSEGFKLIKPQEKEIERFFHFLDTGTDTWWITLNSEFKIVEDNIFSEILNDETFSSKWKNTVQKTIARTRFIKQFTDSQIVSIIKKGILFKKNNTDNNSKIKSIEAIKKQIETRIAKNLMIPNQRFLTWEIVVLSLLDTSNVIVKQKLFRLICNAFEFHTKNNFLKHKELFLKEIKNQIENKNELEVLADLETFVLNIEKKIEPILKEKENEKIQENKEEPTTSPDLILSNDKETSVSPNNSKEKTPNNEEVIDKKDLSFEKEEEILDPDNSELYLDNAGLVLIHPFLKSLFENCKLLNKDNTITHPETAAHLLHYIATGKEQDYENAMGFEKFLCNIPLAQPIERNIVLSEEMKKEAVAMLQAVVSNWEVMKTASAELLQNEFLQRPGKLSIKGDDTPTIIIERKTQDILLDKLNWNLSIIKLAWKKRILYVNW